jgi:hypothetical protein
VALYAACGDPEIQRPVCNSNLRACIGRATAIRADIGAAGEHPIWEEKVQAGTAGYRPATNHDVYRAGSVISDLPG